MENRSRFRMSLSEPILSVISNSRTVTNGNKLLRNSKEKSKQAFSLKSLFLKVLVIVIEMLLDRIRLDGEGWLDMSLILGCRKITAMNVTRDFVLEAFFRLNRAFFC